MAAGSPAPNLDKLPPEMLDFTILKTTGALAPRLGRLTFPGRKPTLTPGFIGNTSRGVIPHVSQDNFRKSVALSGVYVALEDFIEKHPQKTPPIFQQHPDSNSDNDSDNDSDNTTSPLRAFIALPRTTLLILGARRQPPIPSPVANTHSEISLLTSVGYKALTSASYASAAAKLRPDIAIGLADIPYGQSSIGIRRKDKMSDRTELWMRDLLAQREALSADSNNFAVFAPILPIERDLQSWYLEHLVADMAHQIQGLAIYDGFLLDDVPEALGHLVRLSFHAPASPQEILRQVALGMDLFTVPFVGEATDAGIALDFEFPPPDSASAPGPGPAAQATQKEEEEAAAAAAASGHSSSNSSGGRSTPRHPLGTDMWSPTHARSLAPLSRACACYACAKHHRAYLQHLLCAKEMLGWVLLQLHNHAVLDAFFAGVRAAIDDGSFDAHAAAFEAFYEPTLPEKSGMGPRVRGYQFQSGEHGKEFGKKKNAKAFRKWGGGASGGGQGGEDGGGGGGGGVEEEAETKSREKIALKAAHGQQPHRKPQMSDVIDDEALLGLVSMEDVDPAVQMESLDIEDDGQGGQGGQG